MLPEAVVEIGVVTVEHRSMTCAVAAAVVLRVGGVLEFEEGRRMVGPVEVEPHGTRDAYRAE